jgi:hypothetical protein
MIDEDYKNRYNIKNIKQHFKYENIVKELNTIFCNIDTEIIKEVLQNLNII